MDFDWFHSFLISGGAREICKGGMGVCKPFYYTIPRQGKKDGLRQKTTMAQEDDSSRRRGRCTGTTPDIHDAC